MKKIIILLVAVAATLTACEKQLPSTGTFGDQSITTDGATPVATFIASLDNATEKEGKISGKITQVCQSEGCWFNMDMGDGKPVRVIAKDHSFKLPKDAGGKNAIAQGTLKVVTTDVERLKHLAEDEGQTAEEIAKITEPKMEYEFEATSVIIQ